MSESFFDKALNATIKAGYSVDEAADAAEQADFAVSHFWHLMPLKQTVQAAEFASMIRARNLGQPGEVFASAVEKAGIELTRHF